MIYLHKILPLIVSPMFLVVVLITWGMVFRSRIASMLAVSILIICSLPIFSNKLITYLENGYTLSDASSAEIMAEWPHSITADDSEVKLGYVL